MFGTGSTDKKQDFYTQIDLSQPPSATEIEKLPNDLDCLIHCAAITDKSASAYDLAKVNICGSINALEIARRKNIKLFINISGITVVGNILETPITENHPCSPTSFYLQTKLSAEQILSHLSRQDMRMVHLRIPSPVGLEMLSKTILPIFIEHARHNRSITLVGDKRRKQNFLDIRDLAKAIVQICKNRNASGIYNIASSEPISNEDLAKMIISKTKSASKIIDNSDFVEHSPFEEWTISTEKASKDFDFKSNFSFSETLDWALKG